MKMILTTFLILLGFSTFSQDARYSNVYVSKKLKVGSQSLFADTGRVGIGTLTPAPSSILDITSTTKGVLIPRMTASEKAAINSPSTGLLIYQTNSTPGFYYYTGSAWSALAGGGGGSIGTLQQVTDNDSVTTRRISVYGLYLPNSSGSVGNIYKDGSLWAHNKGAVSNIGIGFGSGAAYSSGDNNTAVGQSALASNTTGSRNVAIGLSALATATNTDNSIAIGWDAMKLATNTTDGTVTNTIAIGASALQQVRTGYSNIAIGKLSLYEFLDGTGNAIVGASNRLQSGTFNSGIGSDVMNTNLMNGSYNSFVGGYAMSVKKSGNYNTAIGNHTLSSDTTGGYNTMLGSYAGSNNNGSYNTFLGNFAGAYETNRNHTIIIDGDWSQSVGMKYTIVGQAHDKKIAINKTPGEMDADAANFQVNGNTHFNGGIVTADSAVKLLSDASQNSTLHLQDAAGAEGWELTYNDVNKKLSIASKAYLPNPVITFNDLSNVELFTAYSPNSIKFSRDASSYINSSNLGVGTNTPSASAQLDVTSTTKGFLPPRMTKTQRDAISSPATGLVIYQTDNTPGLRCYNGTNWMKYTETTD